MLGSTKAWVEDQLGGVTAAVKAAVSEHVSLLRVAVLRDIGTARTKLERQLLEVEDRANERYHALVEHIAGTHAELLLRVGEVKSDTHRAAAERAALLELQAEIGAKTDTLLERTCRMENGEQVIRRYVKGGIPAGLVPGGDPAKVPAPGPVEFAAGAWDRDVDVELTSPPAVDPPLEQNEPNTKPIKNTIKAHLTTTSTIDPADAVRGAPTRPPRTELRPPATVTGLPGPGIRGRVPDVEHPLPAVPRVPDETSAAKVAAVAERENPEGLSTKEAAARVGGGVTAAHISAVAKAGKIRGAVLVPGKGRGRWVLPVAGVDAWAAARQS